MTGQEHSESADASRFTHGKVSYLQIPALDVAVSAVFYERVFGWRVQSPQSGFEAPGLIGQWVDDRPPAANMGVMIWINVEDIDASVELVRVAGGEVLELPTADGPMRWLARISDPAGNVVGIVGHGARVGQSGTVV